MPLLLLTLSIYVKKDTRLAIKPAICPIRPWWSDEAPVSDLAATSGMSSQLASKLEFCYLPEALHLETCTMAYSEPMTCRHLLPAPDSISDHGSRISRGAPTSPEPVARLKLSFHGPAMEENSRVNRNGKQISKTPKLSLITRLPPFPKFWVMSNDDNETREDGTCLGSDPLSRNSSPFPFFLPGRIALFLFLPFCSNLELFSNTI